MKRYINIIKPIVFFTLFFVILKSLSPIFMPKDNTEKAGMTEVRARGILGEEKNSIDVIVLGDSESFTSVSPLDMWEAHGFTSYIVGTNAQKIYDTYNYLLEVLEYQSPKVVILETNTFFRDLETDLKILSVFERYLPVVKWHNRWQNLTLDDFTSDIEYTHKSNLKGFGYYLETKPWRLAHYKYMWEKEDRWNLPKDDEYYIDKIYKKCKEKNIELLFYSAPNLKNWWYAKHNTVQDLADKYNSKYIDMNLVDEIDINWLTDTKDAGDHVNYYGAMKSTKYLGNWLKENYDLPDHKDDEKYESWNDAYLNYQKVIENKKIKKYW